MMDPLAIAHAHSTVSIAALAAQGTYFDESSLMKSRKLKRLIEQLAKAKCIEWGAKLMPGKTGRKCKACRE